MIIRAKVLAGTVSIWKVEYVVQRHPSCPPGIVDVKDTVPRPRMPNATRNNHRDPFEKAGRHTSNGSANGLIGENFKELWMSQNQRSRYLKTGGIIIFFLFVFFLLSPNQRPDVGGLVGGSS